jgi:hypothetical protein
MNLAQMIENIKLYFPKKRSEKLEKIKKINMFLKLIYFHSKNIRFKHSFFTNEIAFYYKYC